MENKTIAQMLQDQITFASASKQERIELRNWKNHPKNELTYQRVCELTPTKDEEVFDAHLDFYADDCYIIEMKIREKDYKYSMMLEKKKYDNLIAKSKELGKRALYVNKTPVGWYVWELKENMNLNWIGQELPKTTVEHHYDEEKVVTYLNNNDVLFFISKDLGKIAAKNSEVVANILNKKW